MIRVWHQGDSWILFGDICGCYHVTWVYEDPCELSEDGSKSNQKGTWTSKAVLGGPTGKTCTHAWRLAATLASVEKKREKEKRKEKKNKESKAKCHKTKISLLPCIHRQRLYTLLHGTLIVVHHGMKRCDVTAWKDGLGPDLGMTGQWHINHAYTHDSLYPRLIPHVPISTIPFSIHLISLFK